MKNCITVTISDKNLCYVLILKHILHKMALLKIIIKHYSRLLNFEESK